MVGEVPPELAGTDYYIQMVNEGRNQETFIILKTSARDQGSITYHLNSAIRCASAGNLLDPESRGPNIALSVSREHCPEKHGRVTARCLRDIAAGDELLWAYELPNPGSDAAAAKAVHPFEPRAQLRTVHMEAEDPRPAPQHGRVLSARGMRPVPRRGCWPMSGSSSGGSHDCDEGMRCGECLADAPIHAASGEVLPCGSVTAGGECNAGCRLEGLPAPFDAVPAGSFLCPMSRDDDGDIMMASATHRRSASRRCKAGVQRYDPLVDGRSDREMKELRH